MPLNPFQLETAIHHIDAEEVFGHPDGVPPYLIEKLATEIVRLLVAKGIDPHTVYFRGRQGEPEDLVVSQQEIQEAKLWLALDQRDPDDDYADALHPHDDILERIGVQKTAREEALGRQLDGPPTPEYKLGTWDALFRDDVTINPIHLAGVSEDDSFIDLYDKLVVDGLCPGQEVAVTKMVAISDEQLALAALGCVQLRYEIINDDL